MDGSDKLTRSHESVIEELNKIHAAKSRKNHPLWIGMMTGKLSRPQIAEFLRQFAVIPLYNHFYHGPLYVSCPDPIWRRHMAEVVYEEGTGGIYSDGVAHYELYLRMAEAFGVSREEMYSTEYCGGALAVRHYLENICRTSFLEGYSALSLGGEAQAPGIAGKVSEGFMKYYGLTTEQAMFYSVHEIADSDHSGGGLEFLQRFAPTDHEVNLVIKSVRDCVETLWTMFEDIWQRVEKIK